MGIKCPCSNRLLIHCEYPPHSRKRIKTIIWPGIMQGIGNVTLPRTGCSYISKPEMNWDKTAIPAAVPFAALERLSFTLTLLVPISFKISSLHRHNRQGFTQDKPQKVTTTKTAYSHCRFKHIHLSVYVYPIPEYFLSPLVLHPDRN